MATAPTPAPAVEMLGISKRFGPVQANADVNLRVAPPGTAFSIPAANPATTIKT